MSIYFREAHEAWDLAPHPDLCGSVVPRISGQQAAEAIKERAKVHLEIGFRPQGCATASHCGHGNVSVLARSTNPHMQRWSLVASANVALTYSMAEPVVFTARKATYSCNMLQRFSGRRTVRTSRSAFKESAAWRTSALLWHFSAVALRKIFTGKELQTHRWPPQPEQPPGQPVIGQEPPLRLSQ